MYESVFSVASFVQDHLVQAEYWHDPLNPKEYAEKCIFLPDINNIGSVSFCSTKLLPSYLSSQPVTGPHHLSLFLVTCHRFHHLSLVLATCHSVGEERNLQGQFDDD